MIEPSLELVLYTGAIGLVAIGAAGLVLSRDLFRLVLALAVAEAGANLLLVLAGYRGGASAPILIEGAAPGPMVDPIPQALVLTAIVIGVGVQAFAVALVLRVRRAYGTLDVRELRRRLEREIGDAAGVPPPESEDSPAARPPLGVPAGGLARESRP